MRYLVTWTSPVVFRNNEESIGVYGVEGRFVPGSRPSRSIIRFRTFTQQTGCFAGRRLGLTCSHWPESGALLGEGLFGCDKVWHLHVIPNVRLIDLLDVLACRRRTRISE
jgi:hypothetical protein